MKQNRDINRVFQADLPIWRRWVAGPLRWVFLLPGLFLSGSVLWLTSDMGAVWRVVLWLIAGLLIAGSFLVIMKGRDRRRSWRQDDRVIEPSPGKYLSPLYEEREWSLLSHPFIRYPLAFILIGTLYWALVIHHMKLPGHFLVLLLVLALIGFWSWREPLLLVLLLIVGVALLSVIGWIISLPLSIILIASAVLAPGFGLGLLALRKKKSQGRNP